MWSKYRVFHKICYTFDFECRRVMSQCKEIAQMTVFSCQYQIHSIAKVLIDWENV